MTAKVDASHYLADKGNYVKPTGDALLYVPEPTHVSIPAPKGEHVQIVEPKPATLSAPAGLDDTSQDFTWADLEAIRKKELAEKGGTSPAVKTNSVGRS